LIPGKKEKKLHWEGRGKSHFTSALGGRAFTRERGKKGRQNYKGVLPFCQELGLLHLLQGGEVSPKGETSLRSCDEG